MADKFLTLLEVTKRSGTDAAVGLVEEVTTYAPEIDVVTGRTITGISYLAKVRSLLPDKGAFRNANEGVEVGASTYEQKRFEAYFFDAQMQLDEAVIGATGQGDSLAELLQDEASGVVRQKMITLGKQFYDGTSNDAKGFPGLKSFANTSLVVDSTGSSTSERAWAVRLGPTGVHFIYGNQQGLNLKEWSQQKVLDANNKHLWAWVNNLSGYIGLSCAHSQSVGYVKNITSASGKTLTDAKGSELVSKFPVGMKPTHWFMSRAVAFGLQASRSATSITNRSTGQSSGADVFAPEPTHLAGIPIIITDSIATETAF